LEFPTKARDRQEALNEWYVNDANITPEVKQWLQQHEFTLPLSAEAQTLFVLTFVAKYGVPEKPTKRLRY
jgi:hypothetical protein